VQGKSGQPLRFFPSCSFQRSFGIFLTTVNLQGSALCRTSCALPHSASQQYDVPAPFPFMRPAKSPVTTIRHDYLRGSLRPFIFLVIFFLQFALYISLRLWNVSSTESFKLPEKAPSSPSADGDGDGTAQQRVLTRVSRAMHAVDDEAQLHMLLWRLFIVSVEALHGFASTVSAAVACGASTYITNRVFRCVI
jgi:hypothetical protein